RGVRGVLSRGAALVAADLRGKFGGWHVTDRYHPASVQVELQHRGPLNGLAIHLPFGLRTAFEEDPRGLDRVGVADAQRNLTGMFAGKPLDNPAYATSELLNRFIASQ